MEACEVTTMLSTILPLGGIKKGGVDTQPSAQPTPNTPTSQDQVLGADASFTSYDLNDALPSSTLTTADLQKRYGNCQIGDTTMSAVVSEGAISLPNEEKYVTCAVTLCGPLSTQPTFSPLRPSTWFGDTDHEFTVTTRCENCDAAHRLLMAVQLGVQLDDGKLSQELIEALGNLAQRG
jgi:hypothetical protein